jgi:hypothetical protein
LSFLRRHDAETVAYVVPDNRYCPQAVPVDYADN